MAMVTERVGKGVAFMPFHFGGHFQGKDLRDQVSRRAPTLSCSASRPTPRTTYGYDVGDPDAGNQDHALPIRWLGGA